MGAVVYYYAAAQQRRIRRRKKGQLAEMRPDRPLPWARNVDPPEDETELRGAAQVHPATPPSRMGNDQGKELKD